MAVLLRLFRKVNKHFNNRKKTALWFLIPNPELRGMRPLDMIRYSSFETRVDEAVTQSLENSTKRGHND